jgi:RecA-family ATPase
LAQRDLSELLQSPEIDPPWLVPGLLCEGTMVLLAGAPGAGKSFLSYTLSMSLAVGWPFLGRDISTPRKVLYFDEENAWPDQREYLRWAWRGMGKPDIALMAQNLRVESFSLATAGTNWPLFMIATAKVFRPDLIVVDTATPACQIKEENDNGEASLAIRRLRAAREVAGPQCAMLILKHAKLDSDQGKMIVRGAKAWVGETDATWMHGVTEGRPREDGLRNTNIRPEKVRAFGLRSALYLQPRWVGPDNARGIELELGQSRAVGPMSARGKTDIDRK